MDEEVKVVWPGWETVCLLGQGGFGRVYEIERDRGTIVEKAAVKVISIPQNADEIEELRIKGLDDQSIRAHFEVVKEEIEQEYTAMAQMKGVVNVVYCDDIRSVRHDDGFGWDVYIKMELLTPLLKALKENSETQAIKIGIDICRALAMCGKAGIVHRDVKPQNIFVSKDGTYKLGDFGISKKIVGTDSVSTVIGPGRYMAPEVYNGERYGAKADQYSLGMVLYWLLNNYTLPFMPSLKEKTAEKTEDEAKNRRFGGEPLPDPPNGSKELKRIVLKACSFNPEERFQNAEEMLRELEKLESVTKPETEIQKNGGVNDELALLQDPGDLTPSLFGNREKKKAIEPPPEIEKPDNKKSDTSVEEKENIKNEPDKDKHIIRGILLSAVVFLVLAAVAFFTIHVWDQPTCTEPAVCKICGKEKKESIKGHSWGQPSYSWSADFRTVTARRVCENDPRHVEEESVSVVSRITVPPTCEEDGLRTFIASFANKGFNSQEKTEIIQKTGHNWGNPTYKWSSDYKTATARRICENDSSHVEEETGYSTSKITINATCEKNGERSYTVSFLNSAFQTQKAVVSIKKTGHDWGEVSYKWSEDNKTVSAKRICKNDSSHVEEETVNTTSKVSVAPKCEKDGKRTYSATFSNSAFKTQTKEVQIKKTGHVWEKATYTKPKTCSTCGKTSGYPAKKTVPPTLEELKNLIDSGKYVTKSDKNVKLRIPSSKEYFQRPYRAEVNNGKSSGRIYLMPIPTNDTNNRNGNLCVVSIQKQGWIVASNGPYSFFISDEGKMGWNGSVYFLPVEQDLSEHVNVYVRTPKGQAIYGFLDPNNTDSPSFVVDNGLQGTAFSEYKGFSFVYFPDLQRTMWVNYNYLVTDPVIPNSSGKPSERDLQAVYSHIEYPQKNQYYSEYRKAVITTENGNVVYGFTSPTANTSGFYYVFNKGDKVTIIAKSGSRCCVILDDIGCAAWINAKNLK